jgi:uncharacterized protein YdeI (YjbR/CyaY-like superfamily)
MGKKDPRIDAYIKKSAEFAQPVLKHFRELVHTACPEVEETMKWSMPHFDYKGSMMCSMASFKQHCAISFWKASLMSSGKKLTDMAKTEAAMGHLGRITALKDLPKDSVLIKYIKEGMKLNDAGIKLPGTSKSAAPKTLKVPTYFLKALKTNQKALEHFEKFPYSQKKEYVEWITDAKTEATRDKRMATAVEWLSEGKIKNWKYVK